MATLKQNKVAVLESIQDHNDSVGADFNHIVESITKNYNMGVIHHEEYFDQVQLAVDLARKNYIKAEIDTE